MIRHIVLLKLRTDVPPEAIEALWKDFDVMAARVPGLVSCSRGPHDSYIGLDRGYNYGLTMDFDTVASRDAYHAAPSSRVPVDALEAVFDGSFDEAVIALDFHV
jgi:hypothetical protein